ncbi:MAG: type II secretion system GspH family protein, partial [Lachnospiraceae bacterium]|nr:type II secretion system GspH family protein [Lachnospiraceae bacterium]
FTLVEILIAAAIVGILGAGIFGFMSVGANNFRESRTEVNLQNESQLAFNQMQDLIIDTDVGIEYEWAASGAPTTFTAVASDTAIDPATCVAKRLVMYNRGGVYEIIWEKDAVRDSDSRLFYSEYDPVVMPGNKIERGTAQVTHALMSEHISDFKVDLTRMVSKGIVGIDTVYSKDNKNYESSHNITLRNRPISTNEISEYTSSTPVDPPSSLRGPRTIYLMPGESFNLTNYSEDGIVTGYSVLFGDGTEDRSNIIFSMAPGQTGIIAKNTRVTDSGVLEIGRGQAKDFKIRVSTNYVSNNISIEVDVKVIRVDGIVIDFVASSTALDETGTGELRDNLVENEEFTLTTTVNCNHGDATSATGRTLDKSVVWDKTLGGDMFSLTDNGDGTCSCRMNPTLNLSSATVVNNKFTIEGIEVKATSKHSLDVPYYDLNESYTSPVEAKFRGNACKQKGDFNIIIENNYGNFERGQHNAIHAMTEGGSKKLDDNIVMPDGNTLVWSDYCGIIDVRLVETEYKQDGTSESKDKDFEDCISGEGANWGFVCPMDYNPNSSFTYTLTLHLAEKKNAADGGNMHVAPYAGYTSADYKYSSNTCTVTFPRLILQYQNSKTSNFIISDNKENAVYIPRSFNTKTPPSEIEFYYTYDPSFRTNGQYANSQGLSFDWEYYRYDPKTNTYEGETESGPQIVESSPYCVYDDTTVYDFDDNLKGIFSNKYEQMTNNGLFGAKIRYTGHSDSKWKDVASRFRLVPVFVCNGNRTPLFDNYIDVFMWDIEIPSTGRIAEIINKAGGNIAEKSYFPLPTDTNFPGDTNGGDLVWSNPCSGYGWGNYPESLKYTIEEHKEADGSSVFYLTLKAKAGDGTGIFVPFRKYKCATGETMWERYEDL